MTQEEQMKMLTQAVANLMYMYQNMFKMRNDISILDNRDWFGRLVNDQQHIQWQVTPENSHVIAYAEDALAGRPHDCILRRCFTRDLI